MRLHGARGGEYEKWQGGACTSVHFPACVGAGGIPNAHARVHAHSGGGVDSFGMFVCLYALFPLVCFMPDPGRQGLCVREHKARRDAATTRACGDTHQEVPGDTLESVDRTPATRTLAVAAQTRSPTYILLIPSTTPPPLPPTYTPLQPSPPSSTDPTPALQQDGRPSLLHLHTAAPVIRSRCPISRRRFCLTRRPCSPHRVTPAMICAKAGPSTHGATPQSHSSGPRRLFTADCWGGRICRCRAGRDVGLGAGEGGWAFADGGGAWAGAGLWFGECGEMRASTPNMDLPAPHNRIPRISSYTIRILRSPV
ncbi:hypothetical protein B0H12DRAFT_518231 [Mycena haematopus]|nr:hypothetical protein B0H12DRAFT_518231 [Mycena haematopus]